MQRYWNLYLDGADGFQPDLSPLRADDLAGLPPAYVLTAEFDILRDEGEAMVARLREAGVDVTHRRFEGTIHGFWRWMAGDAERRARRSTRPAPRYAASSHRADPAARPGRRARPRRRGRADSARIRSTPVRAAARAASSSPPWARQSEWAMTTTAVVPPSSREASSERSTSSPTSAPALRITCASPSCRPSARSGSTRASMQVTIASRRAGTGEGGADASVAAVARPKGVQPKLH